MKSIVNAAPGILNYGVKDESVRPYARTPEELPQHLPKFLIYAQKGPCVLDDQPEQLLVGNERNIMYGDDTWDLNSKYFTHPIIYANAVNSVGNAAMYVRLLGRNHGPKPTIRLWLDVLETTVDDYQRNPDGTYKTTVTGDLVIAGQITGYKVKYVVDHCQTVAEQSNFGTMAAREGDQVDPVTNARSTRYPILEMQHSFYGEDGNLAGIRIWPQTTANTGSMPTKMINKERAYPFNFGIVRKHKLTGNTKLKASIFAEQALMVTFKPDTVDPLTMKRLYAGERVIDEYQNLTDPRYAMYYGEFGKMVIYQDTIDTLLQQFHAAEATHIGVGYDFTSDPTDKYLFNFITGTSSKNVPYHTFVFIDSADSVRFSATTDVFARGGSDGEMSLQNFADSVAEYMERYADPDDELMDDAYHVESHVYDSGFPLQTKYAMIKFISERKDTFVHLTPFEFGERKLTQAEEHSLAAALFACLNLYPESSYWGTPVYRGMIQGCTGKIRNSAYRGHVSTNYEIALKSAKYMGAGHGSFKGDFRFDGYPGHIIDNMYDLSIRWVPDSIRVRNWDTGLNWVGRYDRKQFYFPAMKTVYNEDTSVLTSYLTACIIIQVNKVLSLCQRTFSGRSDLTMPQFSERVNNFITAKLAGRFDNRVIIRPRAHFTSLDQIRNYSWTVPVDIGAVGMKTVMTAYAVARRREDMEDEK